MSTGGKRPLFEIFCLWQLSQPVNQSNDGHTVEIFFFRNNIYPKSTSQPLKAHTYLFGEVNLAVLSLVILDKIQSQQVNQEKRTHLFQEAANR